MAKYKSMFSKGEVVETFGGGLVDKFGMPPFSVFDARQGAWQDRKAAWLAIGIKSELGRGENLLKYSDTILEPDPKKRAAANKVASFRDQDKLNTIQGGKKKAVTYGSGGPAELGRKLKASPTALGTRSAGDSGGAWKHKTAQGYRTLDEIEAGTKAQSGRLTWATGRERTDETSGKNLAGGRRLQSASGGGLTVGVTRDAYRKAGEETTAQQTGTSIFDPVLTELFYRWYTPEKGTILDPFCGGSVRGVVASRLGYKYTGFDLRQEQVDANQEQGRILCKTNPPNWICDDACNILKHVKPASMDAIFSCPPYGNLEVYSEDPKDLSTMTYDGFMDAYEVIIKNAAKALKDNRFAAFVVGEFRGKDGNCVGFVPDTITAFEKAGLRLYNDAILITAIGSLSIRVGKQFTATRKLGRTHQYCLVFLKGDSRKAVEAINGAKKK